MVHVERLVRLNHIGMNQGANDGGRKRFFSVLRQIGKKTNPLFAPIHTLTEIMKNRFLVRNLVRREVRGRYRNAGLGYAWAMIEPALLASVYWFLFIMLSGNPDKMYAVWVLMGVIVWGSFSKIIERCDKFLTGNVRTMHLVYFLAQFFLYRAWVQMSWSH